MEHQCLNCNSLITDNFCPKCGQKKYKRIDKKYIWDELQYTVFHANKGLSYSIKNILKNPGKTAKEFIDGNRVNHYKPILLVFVLSGIATFISFKVLNSTEVISAYFSQQHMDSKLIGNRMSFIANYNSIIKLLYIPLLALTTNIAFKKWGHNYYEHIVMSAYILSFYTLISIFFVFPIMFFLRHSPTAFYNLTEISLLLIPIIFVWFFKEFYFDKPLKSVIIKTFSALGLTVLCYFILIILLELVFELVLHY